MPKLTKDEIRKFINDFIQQKRSFISNKEKIIEELYQLAIKEEVIEYAKEPVILKYICDLLAFDDIHRLTSKFNANIFDEITNVALYRYLLNNYQDKISERIINGAYDISEQHCKMEIDFLKHFAFLRMLSYSAKEAEELALNRIYPKEKEINPLMHQWNRIRQQLVGFLKLNENNELCFVSEIIQENFAARELVDEIRKGHLTNFIKETILNPQYQKFYQIIFNLLKPIEDEKHLKMLYRLQNRIYINKESNHYKKLVECIKFLPKNIPLTISKNCDNLTIASELETVKLISTFTIIVDNLEQILKSSIQNEVLIDLSEDYSKLQIYSKNSEMLDSVARFIDEVIETSQRKCFLPFFVKEVKLQEMVIKDPTICQIS